ncbi:MAG: tetratricopeptide repeat protein, partial [Acidobacteria bacterium]|nr:tetratricopeptide repeat protein [Acidobacteriota bacterium]
LPRAESLFDQALEIAERIEDRRGREFHLDNLGRLRLLQGRTEEALRLFEESLAIAQEIGGRRGEGLRQNSRAKAFRQLGQLEKAREASAKGLEIAEELQHPADESESRLELGWIELTQGRLDDARLQATEVLRLDIPRTRAEAELLRGNALLRLGDREAGRAFDEAVKRCRTRLALTPDLFATRYVLAAALLGGVLARPKAASGAPGESLPALVIEAYEQALESCPAPGAVLLARRCLEELRASGKEGLEPILALLGETS